MEVFKEFLDQIEDSSHKDRLKEILLWVEEQFPSLEPVIKWNQPMFVDHGTYIIGFSVAKHHLAVAPEAEGINYFSEQIKKAGYEHTKGLVRFPWSKPFDFGLLRKMIEYNIAEKADCSTFWR